MNTSIPTRLHRRRPQGQRGVYAVEYALVFPIFFVLVYAILSYGIIFAVRLGMQNAAEEGARAGLRYPLANCAQASPLCRSAAASGVAQSRMSWLAPVTVNAKTCPIGVDCASSVSACGSTLPTRCQIVVTVSYDYASNPIAPPLPGFSFLLPGLLQGRASVLLVDGNV